jgi:hypothetical protein
LAILSESRIKTSAILPLQMLTSLQRASSYTSHRAPSFSHHPTSLNRIPKMALRDYVSDSDDSADDINLIQTPKKIDEQPSLPGSALSHRFREPPQVSRDATQPVRPSVPEGKRIAVMVQGPSRPWEYQPFVADNTVDEVLAEIDMPGGEVWYRIEYEDGRREDASIRFS